MQIKRKNKRKTTLKLNTFNSFNSFNSFNIFVLIVDLNNEINKSI